MSRERKLLISFRSSCISADSDAAPAAQQQKEQQEKEDAEAYAAGEMTPEQAEQLLDAQKGEEKMLPVKQDAKPVDRSKPIKDW